MKHSKLLSTIKEHAMSNPQKIAIIAGEKNVNYEELWNNILRAAYILDSQNIKQGDRIVLSAKKEIEFLYVYFGAQALGITNVIVDANQNEKRLQYIENVAKPKCCFGYESKLFPYKLFSDLAFDSAKELELTENDLSDNDIAEILFTTGTTGDPKGVCLSYANIYGSARNINDFIQNNENDIEVLGLPICHSFGLGRIRCVLLKGATIILLGNFANVRSFVKTIERYKATGFGVVPAAWAYIRKISGTRLAQYADQLHYIEIGSAAMPLETKKEMLNMFPQTRICMHYGLTEASRSTFIEFHDEKHLKSIGKPVSTAVDIKIFSEDGVERNPGEEGELCVKGNMVMNHYLSNQDSADAFYGEYFRTGDNGFIDEDGYIYLLGREKELINVGGKKVSPMEVEDAIISLGVGDCVCVPMKDPDGIMGELVKCYIKKGTTNLSFEDIAEKLSQMLEAYKRPVEYEWIDEIPMTSSGKKQRIIMQNGAVKVRPTNGLYNRTFGELKENTDLGYNDRYGIMASLDQNQREAILNKPTGYNPEEICQILAIDNNVVVGTQMCYSARVVADGEEILCNHASTVYSHPDYRSKGVGGNLLLALTKLPPLQNTITGGNSQMSLPIFKALRYDAFEFPRFIYLRKSRCAVEYILKHSGTLVNFFASIIDVPLKLQSAMINMAISKYAKTLSIEKCDAVPVEVEQIVAEDNHRFREQHDKAWFEWNLKYDFTPDDRKSKELYVLKEDERIVGFFLNKIQFHETASSRGFKNVLLGSVMEWGFTRNCGLTELDIQLLAIKAMPKGIDGVQIATDNESVANKFRHMMFFPMGKANMTVRLRSIKNNKAVKDAKNWRLRLACNDTLVN